MLNEINPCHLKLASYWALERVYQTWPGELLQSPGAKLFQALFQKVSEKRKAGKTDEPGCKGVDRDLGVLPDNCYNKKIYMNDNDNYLHIIATSIMTH